MLDADLRGRAAYLRAAETLVVADVHVGRAAASAVDFPLGERPDLRSRLRESIDVYDPEEVVFAGDVLHRFDAVPATARETLDSLVACCRAAGARPVLVRGNHDAMLDAVEGIPVRDTYRVGDALVCHGHERPDAAADRYVVGHDHPAVEIEGRKRPCFLYGEGVADGADLLVLPAFNRLAAGVTVNELRASDFQSPLVDDADALRPLVYDDDEVLTFPPLGRLRRLL